jgi:ParB-like chromosome segregation protein Spo0J
MKRVKINEVKSNPNNPRVIKDEKFQKLVQSLKDFPDMAEVRPIVVNTDMIVLGGNMRLKAMKEAGWKGVPIEIVDWPEDKQREFVIKDNVGYGDWDWELIVKDWPEAEEWGLDVPEFAEMPSQDELIAEDKNKPATMKITFVSPEQLQQAEIDIQEIIDRKYKGAYFSVSAGEI